MQKIIVLIFIALVAYLLMVTTTPSGDATLLNNRAFKLSEEGKYDEALKLYERALMKERQNITGHLPDMAIIYNNMGFLYESKKDYHNALLQHKKAQKIRFDNLGKGNIYTIESAENIKRVNKLLEINRMKFRRE